MLGRFSEETVVEKWDDEEKQRFIQGGRDDYTAWVTVEVHIKVLRKKVGKETGADWYWIDWWNR